MNICLFSEEEIGKPLEIKDSRAQHIIKILHKKEGDSFTAGIIGGASGTAVISSVGEKLSYVFTPESEGKKLHPLVMIIGFPRPIQLKRLLRDMAGLGVSAVHLTGTELVEKSYMSSTMSSPEAARQMLLDGTVQAGSTFVPEVAVHKNLRSCLETLFDGDAGIAKADKRMALDNVNPAGSLWDYCSKGKLAFATGQEPAFAAIGSERGWTDNERAVFEDYGFVRLGMGERILRTETASTVAASIILGSMGVLN
ncbi:MAG: 16S rRNA (uracil(1498)-N(3))-methyltransferase [Treponema sp.]|nr:16S rRNA (uracil(1498)-N(3))-methyltransferase [Treponema sp.]